MFKRIAKWIDELAMGAIGSPWRAQRELYEAHKRSAYVNVLAAKEQHFMQHEAFDAWLYEVIGGRSLDWLQIRDFIEANSQRLERECAWMNQDKEAAWLTQTSAPTPELKTAWAKYKEDTGKVAFEEPKCLCWATAGTCSICWGENVLSMKGWEQRS